MIASQGLSERMFKLPLNLNSKDFIHHRYKYFRWLREEAPVYKGRISFISAYFVSRYDDCVFVLKDPRFVRNRTTATGGGSRMPFPMPRYMNLIAKSMIIEDEPEHRRLRNLVHKAFTPRQLARLSDRIEALTHELLDKMEAQGTVDLKESYALPIPVTVIREMVGVSDEDMPRFRQGIASLLSGGIAPLKLAKALFWDMRKLTAFVREMIERKRANPADDILTGLIQAEEDGERLTEDELVSMVYLLVVAGYETTVHLITNAVSTLLLHPDQLARLRANPEMIDSAIEEVLRFESPVQSTKPNYAREDVILHGVTIPRGAPVLPLLGAANRDPAVFDDPDLFDIGRTPNRHLGFGQGIHYCLGAPLARLEAKIALTNLLARNPNLRLAVDPSQLKPMALPTLHSYTHLPVVMG